LENSKYNKVVILSASKFSAYSLSVIYLLNKNGIKIDLILVKSLGGKKRILKEFKTNGFDLFRKIYKKIILQFLMKFGFKSKNIDGFSEFYNECNFNFSSIEKYAKKHQIAYIETTDFHLVSNINLILKLQTDLIVFTGGGLLRQNLINTAKFGVINCHMGILPEYRGMDCNYWAVLNKEYQNIGFTVHLIDFGVDTGPIIHKYYIDPFDFSSINDLYKHIEYSLAKAIVDGILEVFSDNVKYELQKISSGRQYYTITKELKAFAEKQFKKSKKYLV